MHVAWSLRPSLVLVERLKCVVQAAGSPGAFRGVDPDILDELGDGALQQGKRLDQHPPADTQPLRRDKKNGKTPSRPQVRQIREKGQQTKKLSRNRIGRRLLRFHHALRLALELDQSIGQLRTCLERPCPLLPLVTNVTIELKLNEIEFKFN